MITTLKSTSSRLTPSHSDRQESLGGSSFILHEKGRQYCWNGIGALSIKTFFNGQAFYDAGGGRYAVDETRYLVLNHGQPYSITVESEIEVESFGIFFQTGFAEEVHRRLITTTNRLLDEPEMPGAPPVYFFEKTYPHDDILSPALLTLRASLARRKDEPGWIEEQMHGLMQRLLHVHRDVYKQVGALPAVRAATREELYRRLYRARDYMAACFDQSLTLEEIARIACLSPNHLLRTFKQIFHQTPHQYLTMLRLERARKLLSQTDRSITDICFAVGFDSLGSFSWLFRRRVGVSPESYRRQKR
jgi:AraC-like DNA-binding protein